jgi:branched-chain amino acid transport system ATP-binding protein
MTTVLETTDLRREFGMLVANDDVTVSIDDGEITSIIGPNGAGKTTFYTMLAGQLEPTSGSIRLRPREGTSAQTDENGLVEITGEEPHKINRLGLARAYQINNVFDGLSVLDNIRIARISREGRTSDFRANATNDAELDEGARRIIELARLEDIADQECENLSHGDKRKVEIALALATNPSVVLLDEPTAGMNATETQKMVSLVRELNEQTETTFVLTEHDMEVVIGISDRILVLDGGALIAEGTPEEVMANERVREAYLGSDAE